MKRILLTLGMVLALCATATGVGAQSLTDFEGIETAYGRVYSDGSSRVTSASAPSASVSAPGSTPEPTAPMETEPEYRSVDILGITFESDDAAEKFLEEMRGGIEQSIDSSSEEENAEVLDLDIDKDGFAAVMSVENKGENAIVMFIDGDTVFLIDVTMPDREEATKVVTETASFVADAESESDDVSFNEDGSSTGGVFDRMPESGADVVGGLEIDRDADLMAE